MASSTVFLDLLGPQRASEKGTTCPGDLPPASYPELVERARTARAALGDRAFVRADPFGDWTLPSGLVLVIVRTVVVVYALVSGSQFAMRTGCVPNRHST